MSDLYDIFLGTDSNPKQLQSKNTQPKTITKNQKPEQVKQKPLETCSQQQIKKKSSFIWQPKKLDFQQFVTKKNISEVDEYLKSQKQIPKTDFKIKQTKEITEKQSKKNQKYNREDVVWKKKKHKQYFGPGKAPKRYEDKIQGVGKREDFQKRKLKFQKYQQRDFAPDTQINIIASAEINLFQLKNSENLPISSQTLYLKFMNQSVQWKIIEDQGLTELEQEEKNIILDKTKKIENLVSQTQEQKLENLKNYFGHENFHQFQTDSLNILEQKNQRLLVNSFTGSGKSLIYQYNALVTKGITIVIIPYIPIIVDQVQKSPKEIPTLTLNSWLSIPQKNKFLKLILQNEVKLIFMTPETFLGDFFIYMIQHPNINVSMVCIDETHCVVPWDNNFRISYIGMSKALEKIAKKHKDVNFLFLSATSDRDAINYLSKEFLIKKENQILSHIFLKQNMQINFMSCRDKLTQNSQMLNIVSQNFKNQRPILVYCNFTKSAEGLSTYIKQNGKNAFCFHGKMTETQKLTILNDLIEDRQANSNNLFQQIDIIIATLSLSMGLDVRDIKGVIHYNFPKFLETYIQQIGRSGRNGKISECYLLLNKEDFYFVRNKTISDYFLSSINIRNFIDFLLDQNERFIFINSDTLKGRFGMKDYVFNKLLSVTKIILEEYFHDNYQLYYNIRNQVVIKNYNREKDLLILIEEYFSEKSQLNEETNQQLQKFLKKNYFKKEKCIRFRFDHLINSLEGEFTLESLQFLFKELNQIQSISYQPTSPGCVFEFINIDKEQIKKILHEKFIQNHNRLREKTLFKIDFFYFMCNYLALKKNNLESRKEFEELCQKYFLMESQNFKKFIEQEKYQFRNLCPMVYVDTQQQFEDVKQNFSQFYSENFNFIQEELKKNRNHFQIYSDSLKILLGVTSETYKLSVWVKNKWWGALKFYAFENYYEEIEKIFIMAYDNIQNPIIDSEEEKNNKKITNNQCNKIYYFFLHQNYNLSKQNFYNVN